MYTLIQHNYSGGCCTGGNNTGWTLRVFNFSTKDDLKTFIHLDNQVELESVCYLRDIDKMLDKLIEHGQFGEWCGDDCHTINRIFIAPEKIVLKDTDLQKEKFSTIDDFYEEFFLSQDSSSEADEKN